MTLLQFHGMQFFCIINPYTGERRIPPFDDSFQGEDAYELAARILEWVILDGCIGFQRLRGAAIEEVGGPHTSMHAQAQRCCALAMQLGGMAPPLAATLAALQVRCCPARYLTCCLATGCYVCVCSHAGGRVR